MRWGILLCKFADLPQEPFTLEFAKDLISGEGSLREYWTAMSFGELETVLVFASGWNTLPFTLKDFRPLSRRDRIAQCLADQRRVN